MVFDLASNSASDTRPLDLGDSSVLVKNGVIYLPLRAFAGGEALGWSLYYDPYFGICVSTNEGVPAQSFFPEAEANYNRGLVRYIRSINDNISAGCAQEMVFMLRRAAEVNDIEEKMLIAVMEKESRFNANAVSRSGAIGLMQFMPQTAAGLGLSVEQLYDPKTSIDYGAAYISRNIERFGGDVNLALTAYNQGSGSVSRGSYSRAYANKVQSAVVNIDAYLEDGGYVLPE
jgi:soluble lytic murein transglycosylase-like protein